MPSNAELTKQAEELAAEFSLEVTTEGLNNQQLADLVADLKAKKKDAEDEATKAAAAKKAERMAGKPQPKKKPPFYVAPRCAITSKKGILSGDTEDEVKAEYLPGGKDALEAFIESGHILKG